jgi:ubiquinone/menaquinone biosynthesis C-methylase UbiE
VKIEKIAKRGTPSYTWRAGQERRLELIRKHIPLEGKKILDVGCGIGTYLRALKRFTSKLYGVDVEEERINEAALRLSSGQEKITPNVFVAPAEKLPFKEEKFDVVLMNEVLEHVEDDQKAVKEAIRVLKGGGHLVIFAPNRLYPFETHGFYPPSLKLRRAGLRRKYIFGNIPLINYLPNRLRNKLAPHVRTYTAGGLKKLFEGLPVRLGRITQIYPGFDRIAVKFPTLGILLRRIFYFLEKTPLRIFGLSHFLLVRKEGSRAK